jgi:uncharacterized protein with ATP-grasp and redox domains
MPTPFVKLADPDRYLPCSGDLALDNESRAHWVRFFKSHLSTILKLGVDAGTARGQALDQVSARAEACRREFDGHFDAFAADPIAIGKRNGRAVTILTLDRWRDDILRKHGFVDAFIDLKNRENEKALPLLPVVCGQLDLLGGEEQFRAVIEGVFAGNIFDMGSEATAKAYLNSGPDFFAVRKTLAKRPWLIDDYDALAERMLSCKPHRKAVFFIDNAGSDLLLGALPMIRWMAMRGTRVVVAANERPTLNDMTFYDLNEWWRRILATEPTIAGLPIERVSTGTGEPLIDLSDVSNELNSAAADADLVVLEGMGRGVESNLDARFSCDSLNLAMIKDVIIARRNGGKLFDVVCRFR